jgi:hypothetical protein
MYSAKHTQLMVRSKLITIEDYLEDWGSYVQTNIKIVRLYLGQITTQLSHSGTLHSLE